MKKILDIVVYLGSAWFVGTGILLMMGKITISNELAGFILLCYGLVVLMWNISINKL